MGHRWTSGPRCARDACRAPALPVAVAPRMLAGVGGGRADMGGWRRWVIAAGAVLLPAVAAVAPPLHAAGPAPTVAPERMAVFARSTMVAAAHPAAVAAGRAILRAGGSAVDAAVAVQMVLTLVEPQSSGIGGGAFMLHWSAATRTVTAFDGREAAPAAATPELFLGPDGRPLPFPVAVVGGLSVGVPGAVRMLDLAHRRHGRLPWAELLAPAIALAEAGVPISPRLHEALAEDPALRDDPAAARLYYGPGGAAKPAGTPLANPELADTLRILAREGADALYAGPIAADIVAAVQGARRPGRMTTDDLAAYRAKEREPVCAPYRRWRVCGMGPPSSGGIAIAQALGMLERFDLPALGPAAPAAWHLVAEASRLAFADRDRYVADGDLVPVPVAGLLDRAYLAGRAAGIRPDAAAGRVPAGDPPGRRAGLGADDSREIPATSHLVVVDAAGDAVSMTTSIEGAFGAHVMVRGFLLNNQLTDFSFRPEVEGRPVANRVEAGKRPRSSMSPTIVLDADGRLALAAGSPGGPRIIGYVLKALLGVLDWGLDPQQAIDLPNLLNRNGATEIEAAPASAAIADALRGLGHAVQTMTGPPSGLQAVQVVKGGLVGGTDPRREGAVLGD
ncbi:MAG: gamma-glutamyltransferase [Alphaproteobacteria bacterium]|nr:gamma-glutamyltransferase [Alphaproteobacteria bacterium]